MKVLLITDNKDLFESGSKSLESLKKIAQLLEQVHVLVFAEKKDGYNIKNVDNKIFIYPSNSRQRLLSIRKVLNAVEFQTVMNSQLVADMIIADDPYYSAMVAYRLAQKYKKNFLVNVSSNNSYETSGESGFTSWTKRKIFNYVLPRAHGIRTYNQIVAEGLSAQMPGIEGRIFILPEPIEYSGQPDTKSSLDLKTRYPDFNLFIFTVIETKNKLVEKRLRNIIQTLRTKYSHAALIAIDNNNLYKHDPKDSITWENNIKDLDIYYKNAHMIIDVSNESKPGGSLTAAALMGCPIIAAESPESVYAVRQDKNGFIANPDNPIEFCGAIAEILETPGLRELIRMFKYEMDEVIKVNVEEYGESLLAVWQKVSELHKDFDPGAVEKYTEGFVYSLKEFRKNMNKIAKKIDGGINVVGGKLKSSITHSKKPKVTKQNKAVNKENEVIYIDSIYKK